MRAPASQETVFLRGIEEDSENYEVLWRNQSGELMRPGDWADPVRQTVCLHWLGDMGEPCDCDFLILLNASETAQYFILPEESACRQRHLIMDTAVDEAFKVRVLSGEQGCTVEPHSVVVLQDYCQPCCPEGRCQPQ